jgi:DNA-directed RNA polymerase specialized sigma subunit
MNRKENTDPREILRRTLHIDDEIKALQEEQRQLEESLSTLQSFDYQKPIVKSSGGRGSVENVAIQVADGKERIARKISTLIAAKDAARELIERLPEGAERNVLVQRYILLRSWEQTAVELGYSYRHVIRLHGEALRQLRAMA